jgi:hypothetical protein
MVNLEPLSNTNKSKEAFEKHNLLRISTERGMHIDSIRQPEKHSSSFCVNCDSSSNVTDFIMAAVLGGGSRSPAIDAVVETMGEVIM